MSDNQVLFRVFGADVTLALLLAVIAIVVSVVAAVYARKSFITQETARRHEQEPSFLVVWRRVAVRGELDEHGEYPFNKYDIAWPYLEHSGGPAVHGFQFRVDGAWSRPDDVDTGWMKQLPVGLQPRARVGVRWRDGHRGTQTRRLRVPPKTDVQTHEVPIY